MKLYTEHIQNGGKKASYVIPIIVCVCITALAIFALINSTKTPDKMLKFSGDELYYTDTVTIDEVKKLGVYLEDNDIFVHDGNTISFKIDKKSDAYNLSMIISEEYIDDADYLVSFNYSQSNYLPIFFILK